MPGNDGTGPYGLGPRTGRGFGPCAGYPVYPNQGCGMGYGRGRGYRWMRTGYPVAPPPYDPAEDKVFLENQVRILENQLEQVKTHLKKLDE